MAENAPQTGNSGTTWAIIGGVFVVGMLVALSVVSTSTSSRNSSSSLPNQNGTTSAQAVIPTDPNVVALTKQLSLLADPKTMAKDSVKVLKDTSTRVLAIKTALLASTTITQAKKDELSRIIDETLTRLGKVESLAKTNPGGKDAITEMAALQAGLKEIAKKYGDAVVTYLPKKTAAQAVAFITAKVEENGDGTAGKYKYNQSRPINVTTGDNLDCSGFLGWVLIDAGVIPTSFYKATTNFDTRGLFFSAAKSGTYGFTIVHSGPIGYEQAKAILKPGDIILSGMTLSGQKIGEAQGRSQAHVVMYVGDYKGKTEVIAHSQNSGGKRGPHFTDLRNRMRRPTTMIIRPGYAPSA